MVDSSPEKFARHVRQAAARAALNPPGQQLIVVKSWNEWAEGNHLEPDRTHGRGWLEALHGAVGPETAGQPRGTLAR